MAKPPNVKIPFIAIIRVIVFLFIGFVCFWTYSKTVDFLKTSSLFTVRDVMLDASVQFIDVSELRALKGRNIFDVDITKVHNRIKAKYPHLSQLRVIRELPDRIKVLAQKREAFLQLSWKGKVLLVDDKGVAMYFVSGPVDLPMVQGAAGSLGRITLGAPLPPKSLEIALPILRSFRDHPHLRQLKIIHIDARNPSKIDLTLKAGPHILLDQDHYSSKLDILEMLIAAKKIDFNQVKYIDLRFNQPVLGGN